jgi:hypothetical protein
MHLAVSHLAVQSAFGPVLVSNKLQAPILLHRILLSFGYQLVGDHNTTLMCGTVGPMNPTVAITCVGALAFNFVPWCGPTSSPSTVWVGQLCTQED